MKSAIIVMSLTIFALTLWTVKLQRDIKFIQYHLLQTQIGVIKVQESIMVINDSMRIMLQNEDAKK